jgi:hypothetical protein
MRNSAEEGPRDYFHIGVIGYGIQVGLAFTGPLAGQQLVPKNQIGNSPARIDQRTKTVPDGAGGLVDQPVRFPIWFEPVANGGTPMCEALRTAKTIMEGWLAQHGGCFPPIVINITDRESSDGDPSSLAGEIRSLRSSDGEVLLFNIHLSSQKATPVEFPNSDAQFPDQFAEQLFHMSSVMPDYMIAIARKEGMNVGEPTSLDRAVTTIQLQHRLNLESNDDDWIHWGRWFPADPAARTISPFSKITVPESLEHGTN